MKQLYTFAALLIITFHSNLNAQITIGSTDLDTTTIIQNLDTPWEILWGPDDHIWFTERYGRVSRFSPETGERITVLDIESEVYEISEAGLLGLVLHPDFPETPFVYLTYNYLESDKILEKVVRYTYKDEALTDSYILLDNIRGSGTHNGSRLVFGSDGKIYMSTGDARETSLSQDLSSLNGKILRINPDGTIPSDNPISDSYIYSYGHRNPQGLVFAPSGILYSSEHGPANDDELNIIEPDRNYGWPDVQGFCNEPSEITYCENNNIYEPLIAWTPTLAVAGIDYYGHNAIPEWNHSIIMTTLKEDEMVVMNLSEDGRTILNDQRFFDDWWGRLRDVCIAPDGRIFISTSNKDGRGSVRAGDDRIIELRALSDVSTSSTSLALPGKDKNKDDSDEIQIYPNPMRGNEFIMRDLPEIKELNLRISDISGKVVFDENIHSPEKNLNISFEGNPGIYIVSLRTEKFQVRKILIRE